MNRESNRLALICEGAFDRLLDPPGGVRAELTPFCRVEPLNGFHQANVSFGDQIKERKSQIRVVMSDLNNQAQIRLDHQCARFSVTLLNARGKFDLLEGSQQRNLPNLPKIDFNARI